MRVLVLQNEKQVAQWVAAYTAETVRRFQAPNAKKSCVLGLPTGGTIEGVYAELVRMHQAKTLSFKGVTTFNMDEYLGLPYDHPQSYHAFMKAHLFSKVDLDPERTHLPDGLNADPEAACEAYEAAIVKSGGIRLFLGGVGTDGHIAFNEPGSSLHSRTRVKALTNETILANARFFENDPSKVPPRAITVGVQTIMDADEVMILALGEKKARAVYQAVEGSVNHLWTISALQMHQNAILVCDLEAAMDLPLRRLRYFGTLEDVFSQFTQKHFPSWKPLQLSGGHP